MIEFGKAKEAWNKLALERENYLRRAREVSSLTLPWLLPPEGHTGHSELPTPFQGIGARGVTNLTSKLTLTLFPPSATFFRLAVDEAVLRELTEGQSDAETEEALNDVESLMLNREQEIQQALELRGLRVTAFEALQNLIISGNALVWFPNEGDLQVLQLDRYVIKRDGGGRVKAVIATESFTKDTLPPEMRAAAAEVSSEKVVVYTVATRTSQGTFRWWKEIEGKVIGGTIRNLEEDALPFIPLRLQRVSGESYGRGLGEALLGDLITAESLTRSIVEGAAAAAHLVWLVNPNGFTKARQLADAKTGAFVPGSPNDVAPMQAGKAGDFQMAFQALGVVTQRLEFMFLLNTAAQRNAERVTAEEIRFIAQELEDALGGVYSLLTAEMQLPLVIRQARQMEDQGKLEELPGDIAAPKIVTGIEGLGRGQDLGRLRAFATLASQTMGPEQFVARLKPGDWLTRLATATGLNPDGLVKSDEEIQQEQQAAQQAALAQQAVQGLTPAVGQAIQQQAEQ